MHFLAWGRQLSKPGRHPNCFHTSVVSFVTAKGEPNEVKWHWRVMESRLTTWLHDVATKQDIGMGVTESGCTTSVTKTG